MGLGLGSARARRHISPYLPQTKAELEAEKLAQRTAAAAGESAIAAREIWGDIGEIWGR